MFIGAIALAIAIGIAAGGGGSGSNWAGTFNCYGPDTTGTCYSFDSCTTTLNSGGNVASTIAAASAGNVICLGAGTYAGYTETQTFSSNVTVEAVAGAAVTFSSSITDRNSSHIVYKGFTVPGFKWSGSSNMTIEYVDDTGMSTICVTSPDDCNAADTAVTACNCLVDHLEQVNVQGSSDVGTINLFSINGGVNDDVGITVSHSLFSGGCSDGVGSQGSVAGVTIGPGNEFTNKVQDNCVAINGVHVDPLESFYFGQDWHVFDNYFHDNGDGSGGIANFSGLDTGAVNCLINNNVFIGGTYPYPVALVDSPTCVYKHNYLGGMDQAEIGMGNTCRDSTGVTLNDDAWDNSTGIVIGNLNACSTPSGQYAARNDLNGACSPGSTGATCTNSTGTGMVTGTPVLVTVPASGYYHYQLASSSPGYNGGDDGKNIGICPTC